MNTVGVVGLGQIGGSLALRLLASGVDVVGFDVDAATNLAAQARGIRMVPALEGLVAQSALVFCCVSLDANQQVLARLLALAGAAAGGGPVLSDVASQKGGTLPAIPAGARFVPGHPMAGSHGWGFASAWPGLFENTVWNLMLDAPPPPDVVLLLVETIARTGASVHLCSTPWHDETVALTSGLPHALALALGALSAGVPDVDERLILAAGSFRGASRVLMSEPAFVTALLRYNAPALQGLVRQAAATLAAIAEALGDDQRLLQLVQQARAPIDRMDTLEWQHEVLHARLDTLGDALMALRNSGTLLDQVQRQGEDIALRCRSRAAAPAS